MVTAGVRFSPLPGELHAAGMAKKKQKNPKNLIIHSLVFLNGAVMGLKPTEHQVGGPQAWPCSSKYNVMGM